MIIEGNIKGGVKRSRLIPLDPEAILSTLDVQLHTPTPIEEGASFPD
jgi:hypothetical protein